MYWDNLTATGFFISIVLVLCEFYLELHNSAPRPPQTKTRKKN